MKKTKILTLAASALLLTGCADEFGGFGGGKETVTFTTVLPTEVTRSYGDAISVNKLYCFLYQGDKFVEAAPVQSISGNTATVQLQLAKGVTYDVVFWAAREENTNIVAPTTTAEAEATPTPKPYTYDEATGDLTVDYNQITPNDPTVDAYYSKYTYTGGTPDAITLYRPFAQVNVGTNDTDLAAVQKAYNGGIYSNIEFSAWTGMNLVSGVVDEKTQTTVSTNIAKIPEDNVAYPVDPDHNKYTNMAYILVPQATSSTINFKCNFYTTADATTPKVTRNVDNMPVQKNYRTNVYGALLTSTTDFTVRIEPSFTNPDFNNPKPSVTAKKASDINNLFADGKNPGAEIDIKVTQPITQAIIIPAQTTATTINLDMGGNALTEGITVGDKVILNVKNETPAAPALVKRRVTEGMTGAGFCGKILFTANTGATINIYSGEYKTDGCVTALANGGTINIYGGRFWAKNQPNDVLKKVVHTTNGGFVNVKGGFFRSEAHDSGTYSLEQMGITPDSSCKVTLHSDDDPANLNIWQLVEQVWHPGINLASLKWEIVGIGKFKDPWFRAYYRMLNKDYEENFDFENFADLSVTIKRCTAYPTLYMIENPYVTVAEAWNTGYNPSYYENGAIIFDLHNLSCVPVVPNVYCGAYYYMYDDDKQYTYNLEGAVYYNHKNTVEPGHAHSLENISKYSRYYQFNDDKAWTFQSDMTRYDKNSKTLIFRNTMFDVIRPDNTGFFFQYGYGNEDSDWQQYQRGYLIFPENFVLLDVYGNPVK